MASGGSLQRVALKTMCNIKFFFVQNVTCISRRSTEYLLCHVARFLINKNARRNVLYRSQVRWQPSMAERAEPPR